jgi:hypothetical protein
MYGLFSILKDGKTSKEDEEHSGWQSTRMFTASLTVMVLYITNPPTAPPPPSVQAKVLNEDWLSFGGFNSCDVLSWDPLGCDAM